jgi:RNA polymerase sigma-70 factor (ECF subfamily)
MSEDLDPEESFREIFRLYHARVLAQETFFSAFKALSSFRHESSFLVWLFGIMERIYKNELRRRKAEKRDGVEVSIETSGYEGGAFLDLAVEDEGLLSQLISREQIQALRVALERLPEQMRQCCVLRYERGLKYQEIAGLMKISIETVKAHLFQGRKRLAAELMVPKRFDDESR